MKKLFLFSLYVTLILIYSCSENELVDISLNEEAAIKLNQQHNFLVFESKAVLNETLSNLKELSNEGLSNWESIYGDFVSQKTIYEKAYTEDEKYLEKLSKLPENELQLLKEKHGKEFGFSDFTLKNKDLFFFSNEEDVLDYDLKVGDYNPDIVYVINDKGIVQVGDSIYQYLPDNIKIIRDGQTSKLSELKYITESSLEKNVAVINILKLNSENINFRTAFYLDDDCTGYTSGGGQRVIGEAKSGFNYVVDVFGTYGYPGQILAKPYAYLKATNQNKGLFGWKKKKTSHLEIIGTNINCDFGVISRYNANFHITTSSDIKEMKTNVITATRYYPMSSLPGNLFYTFSGSAIFKGRDGSSCSL